MNEVVLNKSERLINLTMALLASKRFLSKNQIFQSVAGYQGSPETKERMFERDKNDLRALGLDIEVGTDDPLFDDEAGYRINPENYSLQIDDLDQEDLALLSMAARQWQSSLFATQGQSALRKLESLHGAMDTEAIELPFIHKENPEVLLRDIWESIDKKLELRFTYRSTEETNRHVAPLGLYLSHGFWYLVAHDFDRGAVRSFKISRIDSTNFVLGKKHSIDLEGNLPQTAEKLEREFNEVDATILVRIGRAQELRALATSLPHNADWDSIRCEAISKTELFELLARSTDSAKLIEPVSLQQEYLGWIKGKINE